MAREAKDNHIRALMQARSQGPCFLRGESMSKSPRSYEQDLALDTSKSWVGEVTKVRGFPVLTFVRLWGHDDTTPWGYEVTGPESLCGSRVHVIQPDKTPTLKRGRRVRIHKDRFWLCGCEEGRSRERNRDKTNNRETEWGVRTTIRRRRMRKVVAEMGFYVCIKGASHDEN